MEQRRAADFAHYNPIIQVQCCVYILLCPGRFLQEIETPKPRELTVKHFFRYLFFFSSFSSLSLCLSVSHSLFLSLFLSPLPFFSATDGNRAQA